MIASLKGLVDEKRADEVVIDVNGVGYRAFVSLRSMARLPAEGQPTKLRIQTIVREDALDLYGFTSAAEEELFLLLTSVSRVGPKVALNVLSGMEPAELAHAIHSGDLTRLGKLHGVGKKTAERLVVELKEKVEHLALAPAGRGPLRAAPAGRQRSDLVNALVNLGYKPAVADKVAEQAEQAAGPEAGLDVLIREALRVARS
ncbi:MAG TPA: Holliday junction branch migration protein RuvA [Myxococcales bacterium]|nr:Holliday junction branch migration protein RuvA [Myxococcales bacterium]